MKLNKLELDNYEFEVDQLKSEYEWRDPNLEWRWFEWANGRLAEIVTILEKSLASHKRSRITSIQ